MHEDFDRCYRAVQSKDARFDGWFVTAVLTTKIYCRPSCPVRPPYARNMRFYPTAAAAQRAGFRACKRCRPDASPGSPEWNVRGDVVARAMRLIADGTVDREGVTGLAARVGYTTRQLERLLQAEVGANPLALARAQRSQTARVLIETTDAAVRRRRVRRRLLEHPSVQRHGPDGVRPHADGPASTCSDTIRAWRRRRHGFVVAAAAGADAVRIRGIVRPSRGERGARRRGSARRRVPTDAAAAQWQRNRKPHTATRSCALPARVGRLPRPVHGDRAVPATARPRRGSRGRRRRTERRPGPDRPGGQGAGATDSPDGRRAGACRASGARPAGVAEGRTHPRPAHRDRLRPAGG